MFKSLLGAVLAHKQILIAVVAVASLLGYIIPGNMPVAQALSNIGYNFAGSSLFQDLFRSPNDIDAIRQAAPIDISEYRNSVDQSNECIVVQTQTATNVGAYGNVIDQTIDQNSEACTNEIEVEASEEGKGDQLSVVNEASINVDQNVRNNVLSHGLSQLR